MEKSIKGEKQDPYYNRLFMISLKEKKIEYKIMDYAKFTVKQRYVIHLKLEINYSKYTTIDKNTLLRGLFKRKKRNKM